MVAWVETTMNDVLFRTWWKLMNGLAQAPVDRYFDSGIGDNRRLIDASERHQQHIDGAVGIDESIHRQLLAGRLCVKFQLVLAC